MPGSRTNIGQNAIHRSTHRAGSVLMLTLVLIMVGGTIAAALARMMGDRTRTVTDNLAAAQALYLAETGLEAAAMQLRNRKWAAPEQPWQQGCRKESWTTGPTSLSTGGVVQGEYVANIAYNSSSGDWTLSGTGYVPSMAQPQGIRQVQRTVNKCRCIGSFPPLYLHPDPNLVAQDSWYQEIRNIDTGKIDATPVPYTTYVSTTTGKAVDECGQVYDQDDYFTGVSPVFYSAFTAGITDNSNCNSILLNNSTNYHNVTVASNKTNCQIRFTPAFPAHVNIDTLQIDGRNAQIIMTPGHYFIKNLIVNRSTTQFIVDTSNPNPPYRNVNLHIQNLQNQNIIWFNASSTPLNQNPGNFTLWLHNGGSQEILWEGTVYMAGVVVVQENVILRPSVNNTHKLHGGILSWGALILDTWSELRINYQTSDTAKQAVSNVMQDLKPAGTILQPVRMDVGSWSEVR